MVTLSIETLLDRVEAILAGAGLNRVQAAAVARTIVAAERDACKSHGIYRLDGALRTIRAGRVQADAVAALEPSAHPAILRVSARGGFASPAIELGLPALVEAARAGGIAALAINDGVHFAALWPEIEVLAEAGLAGLAMCPSYATVAPTGGRSAVLGTNPLAFGWPRRGRPPYVFDFATSVAARGEIELHRRAGTALPEGWAIDAEGAATTDPRAALAGAMLSFGGHKGSALATMIELLAGPLIGDATSPETLAALGTTELHPTHGELVIALAPEILAAGRPGDPLDHAEALFAAITGAGARLPSERRFRARAKAERDGIALDAAELAQLDRLLADGLAALD